MINGAHVIVYSKDPESDRAFFRDVLKFPAVDAGHSWLIFALPPTEAAFHLAEKNDLHELYFMCDNLKSTMESLKEKNVNCGSVTEERWGSLTTISLRGGGRVGLYQPKHPTAIERSVLPLSKDEWKLKANANYQEVMKTLMTLVTASLILPVWFIRNFVTAPPNETIKGHLRPSAYWSWRLLACSLFCGMVFYLTSAKFVKVVCGGGGEEWPKKWFGVDPEKFFESVRDGSGVGTVLSFLAGLYFAWRFFLQL